MSKGENNSTSQELKDGDDSGSVADGVRHQVFVDGLGICAAPDCNERAVHHRTKLAECAHIIPRKVGSHPREDYKTPLDQRNQETNLLYLCERHHKIIDNIVHANIYTAELLRDWKRTHEEWAKSVTKESPYLPNELKEILATMGKSLASQASENKTALSQLIEVCRNLILRNRVPESQILFAQISTLAIDTNDIGLCYEIDYLNARILRAAQDIPESKKALLELIHSHNTKSEAMAEYVELCRAAPESIDEIEETERLLRDLDPKNPRITVLDLIERSTDLPISVDDLSSDITENRGLFERILAHNSVIYDQAGNKGDRDQLVQEWSERFKTSSKPLLFQAIFVSLDTLRSESLNSIEVSESIETFNRIQSQLLEKDPLSVKDKLQSEFHEFRLALHFARISGETRLVERCKKALLSTLDQCYFDTFVFLLLGEILQDILLSIDEWERIYSKVRSSAVIPTDELVDILASKGFEQPALHDRVAELLDTHGSANTHALWSSRDELDVDQIIRDLRAKKNHAFTLAFVRFTQSKSPERAIEICDQLLDDSDCIIDLLFIKLLSLQELDCKDLCIEVIRGIPLDEVSLFGLETISRIAFNWKEWDVFIHISNKLLGVVPTPELHAKLAMAYAQLYDDSNAITHAEIALEASPELKAAQAQNTLRILVESLQLKGKEDEACSKFEKYAAGASDFHTMMLGADAYLKSNSQKRGERAVDLILHGFRSLSNIDDDVYLSAYMTTLELANLGEIKLENQEQVSAGNFIKISKIQKWFHVGKKEDSMGAIPITASSDNYNAVIGRRVGEQIEWPADRFSDPVDGRKIVSILTPAAFLCHRAHEAMESAAKSGEKPIWEVKMLSEDGSLDVENLHKFSATIHGKTEEIFNMYVSKILPFSLLCKNEGSPIQAMGRIRTTARGFVRCNNGTGQHIEEQQRTAQAAIDGTPCYIDGLAAVVLTDSGLLEKVCSAIPNVGICTSVVRLFREEAKNLETARSSVGRASFAEHRIKFHPKDEVSERSLRKVFLDAADYLDSLPIKQIGKPFVKHQVTWDWDELLPNYVIEPLRSAQKESAVLLTEDAILEDALKASGESKIPRSFSSLSIVRLLARDGKIDWQNYYKYFGHLSQLRFFLLPIDADELMNAVLEPLGGGLVTVSPSNLELLNLGYTLSRENGVNDQTFVGILGQFFSRVVKDESISTEAADEIFSVALVRALKGERAKLRHRVFALCRHIATTGIYSGYKCDKKLEVLRWQIIRFSSDYDPLVEALPSLLRVTKTK